MRREQHVLFTERVADGTSLEAGAANVAAALLLAPAVYLRLVVIRYLWEWFVVPVLHVPWPGYALMLGLTMTFILIFTSDIPKRSDMWRVIQPHATTPQRIVGGVLRSMYTSVLGLVVAWTIHSWPWSAPW